MIIDTSIITDFILQNPANTEIYTLSLHDALPISFRGRRVVHVTARAICGRAASNCWQMVVLPPPEGAEIKTSNGLDTGVRSEEHTSELQSRRDLVCRLLLEKKKRSSH